MKLNKYQSKARKTAIYPGKLTYPALGMCGEIGELAGVVCYPLAPAKIPEEVGDVLWYLANVATDAGLKLSEVAHRKTFVGDSHLYLPQADAGVTMVELAIQAGEVAENVKKTIRDDSGLLCLTRRNNIANSLQEILELLNDLVRSVDKCPSLEECAAMNIKKLRSRQERGVLGGDGDDR